jgi:hypothetical protein
MFPRSGVDLAKTWLPYTILVSDFQKLSKSFPQNFKKSIVQMMYVRPSTELLHFVLIWKKQSTTSMDNFVSHWLNLYKKKKNSHPKLCRFKWFVT